jgi:predicted O-methyltransferase YrrM
MRLPRLAVIIDKLLLQAIAPFMLLLAFLIIACVFISWVVDLRLAVGVIGGLVLALLLFIFRRLYHASHHHYRQIEALFSLHAILHVRHPLPPMREWAISPDLGTVLIALIHDYKPKCIVEASSGVSTLIAGYCVQANGVGRVVSLESDPTFAKVTTHNVARHGLQDVATVIHAPMKSYNLNGQPWLWYDLSGLNNIEPIDLLVVDGPIDRTQKFARFPALPLLIERLSDNAVIVLDDGIRRDEQRIVQQWLQAFAGFELETLPTEKVTFVLRRKHA